MNRTDRIESFYNEIKENRINASLYPLLEEMKEFILRTTPGATIPYKPNEFIDEMLKINRKITDFFLDISKEIFGTLSSESGGLTLKDGEFIEHGKEFYKLWIYTFSTIITENIEFRNILNVAKYYNEEFISISLFERWKNIYPIFLFSHYFESIINSDKEENWKSIIDGVLELVPSLVEIYNKIKEETQKKSEING